MSNCIFCGKEITKFNIGPVPSFLQGKGQICSKCSKQFFYYPSEEIELNEKNYQLIKEYLNSNECPQTAFNLLDESFKEIIETIRKKENNKKEEIAIEVKRKQEELNKDLEKNIYIEERNKEKQENKYRIYLEKLKQQGSDGYYEYKVISIYDEAGWFNRNSGSIDINAMTEKLCELGLQGWHLSTAYTNELGKNALSAIGNSIGVSLNSTIDQHILIFEKFVKL